MKKIEEVLSALFIMIVIVFLGLTPITPAGTFSIRWGDLGVRLAEAGVIDENKFSLTKLKYTVAELERFSFVDGKNSLNGKDILGDFFEGIIREGFKQTKGQFFTHINIVKFMLWGLQLDKLAIERVNNDLEIPYLIDPSAGSGTFLIEYMKFITENVKRRFHNLKKKR